MVGLFAVTAAGIVAVLIGIWATPTHYCQEITHPIGEWVVLGGILVAAVGGLTLILGVMVYARLWAWVGLGLTLASGAGVVVFLAHSSSGWGGCG
jgi:hypothetical protein